MAQIDKPDWLVSSAEFSSEGPATETTFDFMREVYRLYVQQFWTFYKISVPPTILALIIYTGRNALVHQIAAGLSWGPDLLEHRWAIVAMGAVNVLAFFLAWLFEAFALAAISDLVVALHEGSGIPEGDGYARARERFGSVAYVAAMTYLRFVVLLALTIFFVFPAVYKIWPSIFFRGAWWDMGVGVIVFLLVCAALMGYALAVPLLMDTELSGHKAMRASWRLSDGHEGKLFLLIVESLIGGAIAGYAVLLLSSSVFQHAKAGEWAGWAVAVVTALVAASAQAPMLIGFALLYCKAAKVQLRAKTAGASD